MPGWRPASRSRRLLAQDNERAAAAAGEWEAVLDALVESGVGIGAVGFWGVSMGCATGIPLVAAESRITAAVLGLAGADGLAAAAARINVPIEFVLQWDDELVMRGLGAGAVRRVRVGGEDAARQLGRTSGVTALRGRARGAVLRPHVCRPQRANEG